VLASVGRRGRERIRQRYKRCQHRGLQDRDGEQPGESAGNEVADADDSSQQSAGTQHQRMASCPVSGVADRRPGDDPHGGRCRKHDADLSGKQATFLQQCGKERRLHTEC